MEGRRAVMPDFDEDLAAIFLGALDMVPAMEIRPAFEADHIAPAVCLIGLDPLRNRGGLGLPELVGIGKITIAKMISKTNGTPRLPLVKLFILFKTAVLSKTIPSIICH